MYRSTHKTAISHVGSSIIVIHAPKEGDVNSIQELNKKIFESGKRVNYSLYVNEGIWNFT